MFKHIRVIAIPAPLSEVLTQDHTLAIIKETKQAYAAPELVKQLRAALTYIATPNSFQPGPQERLLLIDNIRAGLLAAGEDDVAGTAAAPPQARDLEVSIKARIAHHEAKLADDDDIHRGCSSMIVNELKQILTAASAVAET